MSSSSLNRSAFLLILLSGFSCDCGDDSLGVVAPEIEVSVRSVDFGEVSLGATKRVYLQIKNAGTDELIISSLDAMAPFFADQADAKIPAGSEIALDLGFRPVSEEAPAKGELLIVSNSVGKEMITVALSGEGVLGSLRIEPEILDFRGTAVGAKTALEFVVSNSALELKEGILVTEGFERPEQFDLSGQMQFNVDGRYAVGGRERANYTLEYHPQLAGPDNGRIVFITCGERCGLELEVTASSGEAVVQFDPPMIDFAAVGIGVSRSEIFTIFNNGENPVEIFELSVAGNGFSIPTLPNLPLTIEGKNRSVITVQFLPTFAQVFTGELIIRTSDPTLRLGRVALIGEGEGALFSVAPSAIDFGIERELGVFRRTFLFSNEGSTPVSVNQLSLIGDSVFSVQGLVSLPTILDSGESLVGQVIYEPTSEAVSTAVMTVLTDDALGPILDIPITARHAKEACELAFTPTNINFGLVPRAYARHKPISIKNVGVEICTIESGAFVLPEDPYISLVSGGFPITLDVGATHEFTFRYHPLTLRDAKANFILHTDDQGFPDRLINLAGTSQENSEIFVLPGEVDFGSQKPLCSAIPRQVTVYNAGTTRQTVSAVTVSSTSTEFTKVTLPLPLHIAAGQSVGIDLLYHPTDFGRDRGDLEIEIFGQVFPFVVPLTGVGADHPVVTETFQQAPNRKVDVLFVIDDSCSMGPEQMALAQNFSSFIHTANIRSVDFHIGVTTTDIYRKDGQLVGPVVTGATPNYASAFESQSQVGTRGSGREKPLEAMFRAIERAKTGHVFNRDLLRRDAAFVVVLVTDEDDQSVYSAISYLHYLRLNFSNRFQIAAIYGGEMGCSIAGIRSASASPKLFNFVTLASGVHELICSSSWANTLSNLGSVAFGLRDRFHLNQAADAMQMIEVKVNGVTASSMDWNYDVSRQEISFVPIAVPPESAIIEVTYVPKC